MTSKRLFTTVLAAGSALLAGDVQYEMTSRVTGGSLANMPIVGSKLKEPQLTRHLVKGNRMALIARDITTVYDLDKETVTTINTGKGEYSVMTFAEMREAMDKAMAKMQQAMQQNNSSLGKMNWKVRVEPTGETKEVNGFDATKFIVTMDSDATEQKSGKTIATRMVMETWMSKGVPGGAEMTMFNKRMADKLGAGRAGGMSPMVQAQLGNAWYEAASEFAKMDGFNVQTVTRMSSLIDGQPLMVPEGQQNGATTPQVDGGQVAKDAATSAATSAALGRMGRIGGLGSGIGSGLGGFGRKKKQAEETAQAPAAAPAASSNGTGMVPATTMELQMDVTTMSMAPVDESKFAVPAGFKQVESEMKKMAR